MLPNIMRFDSLPKIDIPYRFFATAVMFAGIAALILAFYGDQLWLNRWHPASIAVMHCFTLGFLGMIMLGALLNILPVLTGHGFKHLKLLGTWGYALLTLGTLSLLLGLLWQNHTLQRIAAISLALGFGCYLYCARAVWQPKQVKATILGLRLALIGLLITLVLGLLLLSNHLVNFQLGLSKAWTNIHAGFGWLVWLGILLMSVAWQVIPMFFVTPEFPKKLAMPLAYFIATVMLLSLLSQLVEYPLVSELFLQLAWFGVTIASLVFWWQLSQRKRQVTDISVRFWRLAISQLVLAFLLSGIQYLWLPSSMSYQVQWLIACMMVFGFAVAVIQAMLLKIMPFLSFTHLQQIAMKTMSGFNQLPNMQQFITAKQASKLWFGHLANLILLYAAVFIPQLNQFFALGLFIQVVWLAWLLITTMKRFYTVEQSFGEIDIDT